MAAVYLPPNASVADIERRLMRFPFSIRIKLQLAQAKKREARERAKARAEILREIQDGLKTLGIQALRAVAAQIRETIRG
jgi:hypothetical protein